MMSREARILALARRLAIAVWILIFVLPGLVALYWLFAPADLLAMSHLIPSGDITLSPGKRLLGLAISAAPVIIVMYAFTQLRILFRLYAQRDFFAAGAANAVRRFAISMFAAVLVDIAAGAALSVAMTFDRGVGDRELILSLTSSEVFVLLLSGVFLLIAHILAEARAIAEENAQIV